MSFGRDVNMSSFLEIEACVSHSGQFVPLKYSQSQGFLMRPMSPHPTSQVLVMSGLVFTAHLWVRTAEAAFLNMDDQWGSHVPSCPHSPAWYTGRVG